MMIMDTALVAVTLVSLALAATMMGVAMRLLREERRRSAARVAALTDELSGTQAADLPLRAIPSTPPAPARREPVRRIDVMDVPLRVEPETFEPQTAAPEPTLDLSSGMFATADRRRGLPRRALVTAAIGILMAVGGTALLTSKGEDHAPEPASAAASGAPLELLSLRHTRQADMLTITGLVRNPDGALPMKDIAAVSFLFDREGSFVASGRAPLDFRTLSAGDESPFVITIPVSGTIGRYRVSFRGASGAMAPHIDKRVRP